MTANFKWNSEKELQRLKVKSMAAIVKDGSGLAADVELITVL
jgi:hypothetical protein